MALGPAKYHSNQIPMEQNHNKANTEKHGLEKSWWVYIIEASDGRYYTGITVDVDRRWQEHAGGSRGAKFFRGRQPATLVYCEAAENRSTASKREAAIKKLSRKQKETLIAIGS